MEMVQRWEVEISDETRESIITITIYNKLQFAYNFASHDFIIRVFFYCGRNRALIFLFSLFPLAYGVDDWLS